MKTSWTKRWHDFKSPLRVVVQILLRSRDAKQAKCQELEQKLDEARRIQTEQEKELERQRTEIKELKQRLWQAKVENSMVGELPIVLPNDPPIKGHGYGPRTVALAVELAKICGFRGAERSMKLMFDWLGVEQKIPRWTSIRNWIQRIGIACLTAPMEEADDWIWLLDHSNQIGPEKVLIVLAIRASRLPPPGQAIRYEDVRVLCVLPGTQWKREDMAEVYEQLAEQYGAPRAIVCDGAVELREGAESLKNLRLDTIVLHDFKHKAANFLKALIGQDERFIAFTTKLGQTRSAIQQTELAHLTPVSQKPKARFMNLDATLRWANMALWILEHPEECPPEWGLTAQRLEQKLGWLRDYADDLAVWSECQEVINRGLQFINEQGLFDGACRQLHGELFADLHHSASRTLAKRLLHFVGEAEWLLKPGERLTMSTEIVESSFSFYKRLERQHSKGGFTTLLASFGALMTTTTPDLVKRAFARVSVKDVTEWLKDHLRDTFMSKRMAAYRLAQMAHQGATELAPTG